MSPAEVGKLTLFELMSTFAAMPQKEARPMTDAEYDEAKEKWRRMNLPDVRV